MGNSQAVIMDKDAEERNNKNTSYNREGRSKATDISSAANTISTFEGLGFYPDHLSFSVYNFYCSAFLFFFFNRK